MSENTIQIDTEQPTKKKVKQKKDKADKKKKVGPPKKVDIKLGMAMDLDDQEILNQATFNESENKVEEIEEFVVNKVMELKAE